MESSSMQLSEFVDVMTRAMGLSEVFSKLEVEFEEYGIRFSGDLLPAWNVAAVFQRPGRKGVGVDFSFAEVPNTNRQFLVDIQCSCVDIRFQVWVNDRNSMDWEIQSVEATSATDLLLASRVGYDLVELAREIRIPCDKKALDDAVTAYKLRHGIL